MPILWRYLVKEYLKVTFTSVLAFVAILLTMRLDEIAHFAALGAPLPYLFFFTLYQVPYILPIAIPLSCLLASFLISQRLSHTHEFTALRASGFSILDVMAPIWIAAAFISIGNFWITSEIATESHLKANQLKSELRAINPLLLLHNKHLMRLKGFYFETFGPSHVGESASDIILAVPNKNQGRLNIMIAKHLRIAPATFIGEGVTLVSGSESENQDDFDHLFIENLGSSSMGIQDFSHFLQKSVWTINNDYLQMKLLLARVHEQQKLLQSVKKQQGSASQLKSLTTQLYRTYSEITKRFSIAIAVFSFTLMGTVFGITISRHRQSYPLYLAIGLTTIFLFSFFIAKGVDHQFWLAVFLYLVPHFLIITSSILVLRRISKGIE